VAHAVAGGRSRRTPRVAGPAQHLLRGPQPAERFLDDAACRRDQKSTGRIARNIVRCEAPRTGVATRRGTAGAYPRDGRRARGCGRVRSAATAHDQAAPTNAGRAQAIAGPVKPNFSVHLPGGRGGRSGRLRSEARRARPRAPIPGSAPPDDHAPSLPSQDRAPVGLVLAQEEIGLASDTTRRGDSAGRQDLLGLPGRTDLRSRWRSERDGPVPAFPAGLRPRGAGASNRT